MKTVNLHAATPHVSGLVDEAVDGQDVVPAHALAAGACEPIDPDQSSN
jgi:hypothetical protein